MEEVECESGGCLSTQWAEEKMTTQEVDLNGRERVDSEQQPSTADK